MAKVQMKQWNKTDDLHNIKSWLSRAAQLEAAYMLVVNDMYSYGTYPVNVMPWDEVEDKIMIYNSKLMQEVIEVYSLSLPIGEQLGAEKAWNIGK